MNFKIKGFILGVSILAFNQLSAMDALDTVLRDHAVYQIPEDKIDPKTATVMPAAHMGQLLTHVVWVAMYLNYFMQGRSWVVPGYCHYEGLPAVSISVEANWHRILSERDKYILFLAALLHDVGKAGDPRYSRNKINVDQKVILSTGKKDHELIGFWYVLRDIFEDDQAALTSAYDILKKYIVKYKIDSNCLHEYRLVPENFFSDPEAALPSFNFKAIFKPLGLTLEEQKLIAFLIGAHKIFTELYAIGLTDVSGNPTPISLAEFFEFLSDLRTMAGLEQPISAKLLEMVIALTAADFYGVFFPLPEQLFDTTMLIDETYKPYLVPRRSYFDGDVFRAKEKVMDDETGDYRKDAQGRDIEVPVRFPGGELGRRLWYTNRAVRLSQTYRDRVLMRMKEFASHSVDMA